METLDWSTATIFPKLDGTLISMYYYGGTFRVSTRGSTPYERPTQSLVLSWCTVLLGHPDAASSVFETPPPDKVSSYALDTRCPVRPYYIWYA